MDFELNEEQRNQARSRWDDAGTPRDDWWYQLAICNRRLFLRENDDGDYELFDDPYEDAPWVDHE